jgi:cation:H+ antiporter
MILVWTQFLISSLIIVLVGFKLSKYGDVISEKSGLEKGWIGFILLALVTSLPEVVTSLGAVITEKAPDLALGNLFGSNLFNLFIIFFLDIAYKQAPVLSMVSTSNILTASLGLLMMLVVSFAIIFNHIASSVIGDLPTFAGVGTGAIAIFILYFLSTRLSFVFDHAHTGDVIEDNLIKSAALEKESNSGIAVAEAEIKEDISFSRAIMIFLLLSVIIVFDGIWLVGVCKELSVIMNWGESFVGAIFMAMATSLPELMVSLGAIAIGSADMAMGNILGSNIFNMFIIFICDVAHTRGIFLNDTKIVNIIPVIIAMMMTAIVIISLIYKDKKGISKRHISFSSISILLLYFTGIFILYRLGLPV